MKIELQNPITTEETITRERFLKILKQADILQQSDFLQQSDLEIRTSKATINEEKVGEQPKFPFQAVYRAAETLNIDQKYIEYAINSTRLEDMSPQMYFKSQSKDVKLILVKYINLPI